MVTTIEELKKKNSFIVEEWVGITIRHDKEGQPMRSGGRKDCEYEFVFEGNDLYITGDVFGSERYLVLNSLEALFGITKEYMTVTVKLKGLDLNIHNPVIRLPE